MYLVAWILVGAVVGWGTGKILKGDGYGPLMDVVMGIGGALVGGFLTHSPGLSHNSAMALTSFGVLAGAVTLTISAAYLNGRRVFARP